MTLPRWPTELPRPMRNDAVLDRGDNRVWSQAKEGPPRTKRGWTLNTDTFAYTMMVSQAQWARWTRFRKEELLDGAKPFLIPDYTRDGWAMLTAGGAPMLKADGTPMLMTATWLCLLGRGLQERPVGVEFRISFQLVVLP